MASNKNQMNHQKFPTLTGLSFSLIYRTMETLISIHKYEGSSGIEYCMFVCFVALPPNSTAMVMGVQSVHLATLFLGQFEQAVQR